MKDVIQKLRNVYPSLSSAKKAAASYFLNNYQNIPFMTVTSLADDIGVSDTTIINLCVDLGFNGFASFKRAIKDEVQALAAASYGLPDSHDGQPENELLDRILAAELENIRATFSNQENRTNLNKLMDMMKKATAVHAVGFWNNGAIAQDFCLQLRRKGWRAQAIYPGLGDYIDKVLQITPDELVFVFDFARYITSLSEICRLLKQKGVPIVLLTDMGPCPTHQYADISFCCHTKTIGETIINASTTALLQAIRAMADVHCPMQPADYEELREGVFTRFNPYGVIEPPSKKYSDRV